MRLLLIQVLLPLLLVAGIARAEEPARVPLDILSAGGVEHRFEVEIAATPEERGRGLMFRDELAADRGMLFIFPRRERVAMWMRNTRIPLDMLFIDDDGRVIQIHQRTVPYSEATVASRKRVRYVLELPGGTADRLGLAVGDRVVGAALPAR